MKKGRDGGEKSRAESIKLEITPEKKKGGNFWFWVFLLFRPSGETLGAVIGYRTARMGYLRRQTENTEYNNRHNNCYKQYRNHSPVPLHEAEKLS